MELNSMFEAFEVFEAQQIFEILYLFNTVSVLLFFFDVP